MHLMAAVRGLTCASAWQMRSFARREKWCTLGSVFITASYLLTASSYLKEQEAGTCFTVMLAIQQNETWISVPTNVKSLRYSCLLLRMLSYVSKYDLTSIHIQMGFACLFVRAESRRA